MGAITIAHETLRLMELMVNVDQGARYRGFLKQVLPHIGDAYRNEKEGHRSHLGASILGRDCARAIWYNFRWASTSNFTGRMMRLFNRGHLEEGRFIALLLTIGCQVYQQDENGKQYRISHADGHVGGSGDGVVIGVPDLPLGTPALGEFKTHNKKSFEKLAGDNWVKYVESLLDPNLPRVKFEGEGVREAKFDHYVQMNIYARKMGLPVTLYVAVNKDDDSIYCELVPLDANVADQFLDRGEKLVRMEVPPEKLSKSPGFWKCKFCDVRPVCHLGETPDRNCRTCAFSLPAVDGDAIALGAGAWVCRLHEREISKTIQLMGCDQHQQRRAF